jgi:hypothetical protein
MVRMIDRMPPAIGQFISNNVYDGKLLSNPQHTVRSNTCCRFVEIIGGEEKKAGHSWEVSRTVILGIIKYLTIMVFRTFERSS